MLKRIELHNHSLESDGRMSVSELVSWLVSNRITAFSLTDHNTVSGLPVLKKLQEENPVFEYLNGYELTSWYGHILCQNVSGYIPWDDCDRENGDVLFDRVHAQGGLAGIAHPVSFPHPVSNGLRFEFLIHDWSKVDFIEIINNSHPAFPDNGKGIRYLGGPVSEGICAGRLPRSRLRHGSARPHGHEPHPYDLDGAGRFPAFGSSPCSAGCRRKAEQDHRVQWSCSAL